MFRHRRDTPHITAEDGKKYKSINDTYLYPFLLAISFMYPNPQCDRKRKITVGIVVGTLLPTLLILGNDMRLRIQQNDIPNLTRQSIVCVSITFVMAKMLLTIYRNKEFRGIIDDINEDYDKYNNLPENYQQMVDDSIRKTKILQKIWIVLTTMTALSYPLIAIACTVHSILCTDHPKRFMIHEFIVPFLTEEEKYEFPYYEVFSVYSAYDVWMIYIGFTGFDGMFTVFTIHMSLKVDILIQNIKRLFVDATDDMEIMRRIAHLVDEHCEIIRLMSEIQKCFEIWLSGVFLNAVLQIGMALIQVTNSEGSKFNSYYFFAVATVVHLYLPCSLTNDITFKAGEIATAAYCCGWETTRSVSVRRAIVMIIFKAQEPIYFTAFGMLTFNMEMFASILQTTYSMYTLLRS